MFIMVDTDKAICPSKRQKTHLPAHWCYHETDVSASDVALLLSRIPDNRFFDITQVLSNGMVLPR